MQKTADKDTLANSPFVSLQYQNHIDHVTLQYHYYVDHIAALNIYLWRGWKLLWSGYIDENDNFVDYGDGTSNPITWGKGCQDGVKVLLWLLQGVRGGFTSCDKIQVFIKKKPATRY